MTGSSKSGSAAGGAKTGNGGGSKSGSGTGNSKSGGPVGTKSGGSGNNGSSKSVGGGGGSRGRPRISSITAPSPNSTPLLHQSATAEETTSSGNTGGDSGDNIPFKVCLELSFLFCRFSKLGCSSVFFLAAL